MGASQRRKGGDGERELVRHLRDLLGEPVERNLDQPRAGGGDILLPGWSIEAKRAKAATLTPWWTQTVEQAAAVDRWPALAYRLDRQPWRVRVSLLALTDAAEPVEALEWTAELSLPGFAALVREGPARRGLAG